jgi:hypothetical protein
MLPASAQAAADTLLALSKELRALAGQRATGALTAGSG